MKCPFCDTEMLHGYLNCGNAIWSDRKHRLSMLPDQTEKYALDLGTTLLVHHIESDCCPNCKKIVIDAANYKTNIK